ncbi:MAG: hypothetical protein J5526_00725 [Bacteroidales bacterium]|nr:hypothetical protein [Bacteroidales bacterium]
MKKEKIVEAVAWIGMQFVALVVFILFYEGLAHLLLRPRWLHGGISYFVFSVTTTYMIIIEALIIAVVGLVLLRRHGYGSKKFWKHFWIWYGVFLALHWGIMIIEGFDCDLFWWPPFYVFAFVNSCYPGIVLLCLMGAKAVAKGRKRGENEKLNENKN